VSGRNHLHARGAEASRFTYQFPPLIKYLDFGTCKISPYCRNLNVQDKLVDKANLVRKLFLVYLFRYAGCNSTL